MLGAGLLEPAPGARVAPGLAVAAGFAPGLGGAGLCGVCGIPTGIASSTSRKRSAAVLVTLSMLWRLPPGTLTTIWSPWVTTSASETPAPLTRWPMISTAVSSWVWLGRFPLSPWGVRMTLAPPRRSRPSFGFRAAPPLPVNSTTAYSASSSTSRKPR